MAILERTMVAEEVCRIFGLDPDNVTKITLELEPFKVTAHIERVMKDEEAPAILKVLGEYELAPKGWREMTPDG